MINYKQIVKQWSDEVKNDLVKGYEQTRRRASGNWEKELEDKQDVTDFKVKVTFLAPDYTKFMEDGRKPNKDQSKKAIRSFVGFAGSTFLKEWAQSKGVSYNPFAVAYKIATEGYEGKPFVGKSFNEDKVNELANRMGTATVQQIRSDIIKSFK